MLTVIIVTFCEAFVRIIHVRDELKVSEFQLIRNPRYCNDTCLIINIHINYIIKNDFVVLWLRNHYVKLSNMKKFICLYF